MFRKRKRRSDSANGPQPGSAPAPAAPGSSKPLPGPVRADRDTRAPEPLTEAFKGAIEKAADRARTELASKGKIEPMAFFVHADGTMKVVSLVLRGGQQKEALLKRIREKVSAENAFAVVVINGTEQEHGMVISGVTPGASASTRVDFGFDKKTKTVTSWKLNWLNRPVRNVLIDGIFDKTG